MKMVFLQNYLGIIVLDLFFLQAPVRCLSLTEVRIPSHTVRSESAHLECHYSLDGQALYSVKWYKDGHEFYRFVPRDMPPAQVFPLDGVHVDLARSTDNQVILQEVNLFSTGRYRCEVSAEAPSFETVTDHGYMVVVALPEDGPRITGGHPRYQIGETVRVNCTSGRSKPAAQLNWFINGEAADPSFLRGPDVYVTGREGLETAMLCLEFRVRPKHFKRGDMKLKVIDTKCLATISTLYWRSNEESVEGEKSRRPPALESRGTGSSSTSSRSHRVQVTYIPTGRSRSVDHGPRFFLITLCGVFFIVTHFLEYTGYALSHWR